MENEEKKEMTETQAAEVKPEKAEKKKCCGTLCPCKVFLISLLTSIIVVAAYHCVRLCFASRCRKAAPVCCKCGMMPAPHGRRMKGCPPPPPEGHRGRPRHHNGEMRPDHCPPAPPQGQPQQK